MTEVQLPARLPEGQYDILVTCTDYDGSVYGIARADTGYAITKNSEFFGGIYPEVSQAVEDISSHNYQMGKLMEGELNKMSNKEYLEELKADMADSPYRNEMLQGHVLMEKIFDAAELILGGFDSFKMEGNKAVVTYAGWQLTLERIEE